MASGAYAGTQTWTFPSNSIQGGSNYGNYIQLQNSSGLSLKVTGWSDTGGSNDNRFESAMLMMYNGGIGLINREEGTGSPDHSVDSAGSSNDTDFLLLEFNEAINLDAFRLGWGYDSGNYWADVSIAAYGGSNFTGFNNVGWDNLLASNWVGIGNYSDSQPSSSYYYSTQTSVTSKYWLIGAYNNYFSGLPDYNNGALGAGNDGFKLSGLKTEYSQPSTGIPEPGILMLFALGLLTLLKARRHG